MQPSATVVLVGRDSSQRDEVLNHVLVRFLQAQGVRILWEDPAGAWLYALRRFQFSYAWLPSLLRVLSRRVVQFAFILLHPSYLKYLYHRSRLAVEQRADLLKSRLKFLKPDPPLVLLGRSSGARISTLLADELAVSKVICLGYPFQHPEIGDEPARYRHLESLRTPTLIIQGTADEYGGRDVITRYPVSGEVEWCFIETDHNFDLAEAESQFVLQRIRDFIQKSSTHTIASSVG